MILATNHNLLGGIMNEILEILEKNARATPEEIAKMLNMTPTAVRNSIKKLEKDGIMAKVVSMPCVEVFAAQTAEHRGAVLEKDLPKVFIEAGRGTGWKELASGKSLTIGIETFGLSAPDVEIFKHFGFTPEAIAAKVKEFLGK